MTDSKTVRPWVVHSEKVVLSTRVFTVKEQQSSSQINEGLSGTFSVLDCPNWVNVIAITKDDEVILIRQHRHGLGELTIEIPGGMVDGDEAFVAAGLRELVEETGFAGEDAQLIGVVTPNPAIQDNRCGTLLVTNCRKVSEGDLDAHEEIDVFLAPLSEVKEMMRSGVIHHALVLAAFQHLSLRG